VQVIEYLRAARLIPPEPGAAAPDRPAARTP